MKLHCYQVPPIDYWIGYVTEEELLAQVRDRLGYAAENIQDFATSLEALKKRAKTAFLEIGWEGDTTHGEFYFGIPNDDEYSIGYVIKQSNNGSCFIATPEAIPGLDGRAMQSTSCS